MIEASEVQHIVVHRDSFAYCAHPHMVVATDGSWIAVFNRAPRRPYVLHPPEQPLYHNAIIRSPDRGGTWSVPEIVPGYGFTGTECAGLTPLKDGRIVLNQWRFAWYPLGLARRLPQQSGLDYPATFMKGWLASPEHDTSSFAHLAPEQLAPWVRGPGRTFVHTSDDNGISFGGRTEIDTQPFSGGYGMRGGVELPDSRIILPLSDVPNYRQVFTVDSGDGGRTWSLPRLVAGGDGHEFEEPAVLRSRSGKIIMVLRDNATRHLHQVESLDEGASWTAPRILDIAGYPAHLLQLQDGRLLMTFGWRYPDFGIRTVLSNDDGANWDTEHTFRIRGGLPPRNLGYPVTVQADDGRLFTIYYGEDDTGVTCIMGSHWCPPI